MKKRLPDPLAAVVRETVQARPKPAPSDDDAIKGEAAIRRRIRAKSAHNYYLAADGQLYQKIPVYLPAAQAVELKMIAARERRTLSALVREVIGAYMEKAGRVS